MSLQGPIVVIADTPSGELVEALGGAGAFPIIEATWADAPTAVVSVKPCAVVIADPGPSPSEANARMLCLQIATATGPMVPVIGCVTADGDLPVPIAVASPPSGARVLLRLNSALRVRALHATVLRRIESFGSEHARLPELPIGDPLEEATIMIVGRGPLYPALSVAIGERVSMVGALSVENAARHLNSRDIDGIVVGDGFSQRMVEAFLTVLAQDERLRNVPAAVIGEIPGDLAERLPNVDQIASTPARLVSRLLPLVRLHAFERRLKRMLRALDSNGIIDPKNGLLCRDAFWQEFNKAVRDSLQHGHALSVGRFSFAGDLPGRACNDAARLVARLIRDSDFAHCDEDAGILIVFGQTDLGSAHIIARRIAAVLRNAMLTPQQSRVDAHVTLATLKGTDTVDSLMMRVNGGEVVAAE